MRTITDIARDIVAREGGYVNDPDDPGGATKYGVTIHTMRRLGLDLNGDGQIDRSDVQVLTRAHAVSILVEHYFRKPQNDQLPPPLQASVFDMYVNAGAQAVKILQRLLCEMRIEVVVDGIIGPLPSAVSRRRRIIWRTLTGLRGGNTTTIWRPSVLPAANMPARAAAAKAGGSSVPRNLSPRAFI